MFDVVVVGGNLSGITAAIHAVEKGVTVAVIERNKKPYNHAHCGEGIDSVTINLLNTIIGEYPKNEIKNLIINVTPSKQYLFTLKKFRLFTVNRNTIENKLLKKAKQQGVTLLLGRTMKNFRPPHDIILENKDIIKGKIIIDATGIACQIGRRTGMATKLKPNDIGVCIQSRVQTTCVTDTIKMWFHTPYAPFGYAWFFPLYHNLANIGLGVPGGKHLNPEKLLNNYIQDTVTSTIVIKHTFRSCVPSAPPLIPLTKNNVMVTGDAARLTNPILGNGIANAIISGGIAGKTAAKYIKGEIPSLEIYQKLMQKKLIRLQKMYKKKTKLKTEQAYTTRFKRAFAILHLLHTTAPIFFEKRIIDALEKDISLLKEMP